MGKIYEQDFRYDLLRVYVDFCTRTSYRETTVCGQENIPTDGAVIIAPNHCNTLMDALVVLRARRGATVFGARADLFKKYGKPLTFLRIVPMVRLRDGLREVEKNRETNEKLMEVLENDVPFCIFSEGTHRPKHSLLPITKGVVRIALEANGRFGDRKPVYIVPAGIEYGDYFRYRSTSMLQYGKAINVTEFVREHPDMTEAQISMELRTLIGEGISKLITYIGDDEKYDAKWSLVRILSAGRRGTLRRKLAANKKAVARVDRLFEEQPERMEALGARAKEFDTRRKDAGVSMLSFNGTPLAFSIAWKTLAALVGLPFLAYYLVACLPFWVFSKGIRSKVKDRAFHNTVHFVSRLIFTPIMMILWAIVFFCTLPGPVAHSGLGFLCPDMTWLLPLVLTLLVPFGHSYIYDYLEFVRVLFSDWRLFFRPKLKKEFLDIRREI